MEYKILNFPDAMRVAQIVTKYMPDTESIKGMTGEAFGYKLFELLDMEEILPLANLLVVVEETAKPKQLIQSCIQSMIKNNLLELLTVYKSIGFEANG